MPPPAPRCEGSCEGQTKKPFTVRCQDEKEEMALHKLARLNVVKEEAGPGQHLESTFKGIVLKIIKIMGTIARHPHHNFVSNFLTSAMLETSTTTGVSSES